MQQIKKQNIQFQTIVFVWLKNKNKNNKWINAKIKKKEIELKNGLRNDEQNQIIGAIEGSKLNSMSCELKHHCVKEAAAEQDIASSQLSERRDFLFAAGSSFALLARFICQARNGSDSTCPRRPRRDPSNICNAMFRLAEIDGS